MQAIEDRGVDFVVQEAVTLSTMPVWHDGQLEPRPFILRLFLARTGEGWSVMPGGFVRIADDMDARAVSLQRGGAHRRCLGAVGGAGRRNHAAADAGAHHHPARDRRAAEPRRRQPVLGRPLCRARRSDAAAGARADQPDQPKPTKARRARDRPHQRRCSRLERGPSDIPNARPVLIARAALQRDDLEGSLPHLVGAARSAASVIRDRFSPDAWRALTIWSRSIDAPLPAGPAESVDVRARRRGAAHHLVVLRAGAGEHDPARRLALPRARPPDRARDR